MPGFDTAATIVSDVAKELGLVTAAITDPFTATDQNIVQLVAMLKPTGRMLLKAHPWSHLMRETTFETDTSGDYGLEVDFGRFVDGSAWNRTTNQPILGSLTPQQWQQVQSNGGVTVTQVLRVWLNRIRLYPDTANEDVYYEYVSRYWGADAFAKEAPTAAADVVQFDAHLFSRALILRFKTAKGFDTTAALDDYNEALRTAIGQDGAAQTLSLNARPAPWPNVPETGFGQ